MVRRTLARLAARSGDTALPEKVDLREFCPLVADQHNLPTSSAHACVAMVQYYERRSSGRFLRPSRLFVHQNARRLSSNRVNDQVSLRATLKSMVRFGFPPERHWPYEAERLSQFPDAFAYGFERTLRGCKYIRLDAVDQTGTETLNYVKAFLASGYSCVFGCPLPTSLADDPDIYFPMPSDELQDGQAMLCVGYDDRRWIRSDKGALLVQNSWGRSWGQEGFGWLPYRYVERRLAVDFWSLLRSRWLKSGEFFRPL